MPLDLTGKTFGNWTVIERDLTKKKKYYLCKCSCGNPDLISVEAKSLTKTVKPSRGCGKCKRYEMIGKTFGKLTVLGVDLNSQDTCTRLLCQCSCGNPKIKSIPLSAVRKGRRISCGECVQFEMIGKTFNKLTVLEYDKEKSKKQGQSIFKCQCSCENKNIVFVAGTYLKNGSVKSCGCLIKEAREKELTGQIFGYLQVLYRTNKKDKNNCYFWHCRCLRDGNECDVITSNLIRGHTRSCGCLKSIGEGNIQQILQSNNIKFEKEKAFFDLKSENNGYYRYDFYLPDYNRLIEFDGIQHFQPGGYFGRPEQFEKTQQSDKIKNEYALSHNIDLVRIPYTEKDNLTLEKILGEQYLI